MSKAAKNASWLNPEVISPPQRNSPFELIAILQSWRRALHGFWRGHLRTRVSLGEAAIVNEYDTNIQIAELNALNATFAVIKWKKLRGIYLDLEGEHHSTFTIDGNLVINDDQGEGSRDAA